MCQTNLSSTPSQSSLLTCCHRARPPTYSSLSFLKITDYSLYYVSPHLWNKLPGSYRQSDHSHPDSSLFLHLTAHYLHSHSPLTRSVTPHCFIPGVKRNLFSTNRLLQRLLILIELPSRTMGLFVGIFAFICFFFSVFR